MATTFRIVLSSASFTILSTLAFKGLSALFDYPTNKDHLASLNYKTLFEIKSNQFSKWKINYFLHREEANVLIPEFKNIENITEGGYLLKKWCEARLNESYSPKNSKIFNMIKKYCTLDAVVQIND